MWCKMTFLDRHKVRKKQKPLGPQRFQGFCLAAGEGFEPSHTESESAVLPLHNPAISAPLSRAQAILYAWRSNLSIAFSKFFQFFLHALSAVPKAIYGTYNSARFARQAATLHNAKLYLYLQLVIHTLFHIYFPHISQNFLTSPQLFPLLPHPSAYQYFPLLRLHNTFSNRLCTT